MAIFIVSLEIDEVMTENHVSSSFGFIDQQGSCSFDSW